MSKINPLMGETQYQHFTLKGGSFVTETKQQEFLEVKAEKLSATSVLTRRNVEQPKRITALAIATLAVLISIFHLYSAAIGAGEAYQTRSFVVSIIMILGILLYPLGRGSWDSKPKNKLFVLDIVIILVIVAIQAYLFISVHIYGEQFYAGVIQVTTIQIVIGTIYAIILLDVTRRSTGWPMVIIALVFIAYALFAESVPGIFQAPNTSLQTMMRNLFLNINGIFGVPVGAMIDYVVVFVVFGSVLGAAGAGKFFTDIATALTGGLIGGPAKAAIVSSGLMGTISGSAVSNVVTVGTVTIPLMKSLGYPPAFAGAVEAVASTGGAIMPPVMGAVAFVMAQFIGVPYSQVALAATVPAFLYYFAAYWAVHWEAMRLNLRRVPKDRIPKASVVMKQGWYYLVPIVTIVVMLAYNLSITMTAFMGVVLAFLSSFVRKETRITPIRLLEVLEQAGRSCVTVIIAAAAAGIIIVAVNASGLTWRISSLLIGLSHGYLLLALLFSAVVGYILGMGVSTTAVYVTMAGMLIPAIIKMGVVPMAAHMFALYFAILGMITPPVALAAFAAAGVAETSAMRVGYLAMRIALPTYIIPFVFAYHPALLLQGSPSDIIITITTAIIGVWLFAGGSWGRLLVKSNLVERLSSLASGFLLILPSVSTSVVGLLIAVGIIMSQIRRKAKLAPEEKEVGVNV